MVFGGYISQSYMQKKTPKKFIGDIDVTGSRFKADEKQFLEQFSTQYDRSKGKKQTIETKSDGWSSDGRYTRYTNTKHSFADGKMGITIDASYKDDDGLSGSNITSMENGRNIINYVKENRNLEMFGDVRDIVDILL